MTVSQVYEWLNELAPFDTAEDFDNVGLLVGDPSATVTNVLFGMDLTETMAQEAVELQAELIITHHPLIFSPLRRIDYQGAQGRAIRTLIANGISVIAAHTNWDKAPGGVSDSLAQALSLSDVTAGDEFLRIGTLKSPQTAELFAHTVQNALHIQPRLYGDPAKQVSRVAVAGGAYGEGYALALSLGADAYVVGEMKHHEVLDACAGGLVVLDAGHFATELPGVAALYERFLADAVRANRPVKAHLHLQAPYVGATLAF